MVLSSQRQIVFYNHAVMELMGIADPSEVLGKRPGEMLDCIHSGETEGGCGTTESCSQCGAVLAILAALAEKRREVRECLVTVQPEGRGVESREFQIVVEPLEIGSETFLFFVMIDISNVKRRKNLEEVFFHDLRNLTTALYGQMQLLEDLPQSFSTRMPTLMTLIHSVVDSLEGQQMLQQAERKSLIGEPKTIDVGKLVEEIVKAARNSALATTRSIALQLPAQEVPTHTDRVILQRVLVNMIKNALEASKAGETITVGCDIQNGSVELWVHNASVIPRNVQLQIFNRSFSTKGPNRGLGTYGMRLLTEQYLGGRVGFVSNDEKGTRFFVTLPAKSQA